jgi:hypothetical protein
LENGGHPVKIIDTLLLVQKELKLILNTFPNTYCTNLSKTSNSTQQYQISLDIDEEDAYYNFLLDNFLLDNFLLDNFLLDNFLLDNFLLDNFLPMSSTNFLFKLKTDESFAERMRLRIEE